MNEDDFNLDLNLIEKYLKRHSGLHVESAMKMPDTVSRPVSRDTLFVLPLGDHADPDQGISGEDVTQETTDKFAVVIAMNAKGSPQGVAARSKVLTQRNHIKSLLVGLLIADFEPISYDAGALMDANTKTQNLLYQCQFVTSRTVVTEVKDYDE